MGLLFTKLSKLYSNFHQDEARILMLGLDAAGKTTLLYKLKLDERVCTIPTIGFNVETVTCKGITFTVWDIGGQDKIRSLWKHYYQNVSGLLFVVDSNDRFRIGESRHEMNEILRQKDMDGVPVIIMANKQDIPDAMSTTETSEKLQLEQIHDRQWHIQATSARTGEGIFEAMDMMKHLIRQRKRSSKH